MQSHKQEPEHELYGMLTAISIVGIIFVGLLGALVFVVKEWFF